MFTRVVALLGIVAAAGIVLGIVGLMSPGTVDATQHSASRSFSADSVAPGAEVVVTITASGFGAGGPDRSRKRLPQDFGYVSSHAPLGPTMTPVTEPSAATIFGDESTFEYTVTACQYGWGIRHSPGRWPTLRTARFAATHRRRFHNHGHNSVRSLPHARTYGDTRTYPTARGWVDCQQELLCGVGFGWG